MATNYYVDEQGRLYSSSSATRTSHSQLPFVSAAGAAAITATPTVAQVVNDAVLNTAIAAGTTGGTVKKMH